MENLVESLKEQTKTLRIQFIDKTREWANAELERNINRAKRYDNLPLDMCKGSKYYQEQKWRHNSPAWFFKPEFIDRMVKKADDHYSDSIEKLAFRIIKCGLIIENIKIKNASVGVNIECAITDDIKTVRAYTIVASGVIQRPHYRFLLK